MSHFLGTDEIFFHTCFYLQVKNLKLEHELEKNKILSEALETLATEHHELEQSIVKGSPPLSILSEEQFYDAVSGKCDIFKSKLMASHDFLI